MTTKLQKNLAVHSKAGGAPDEDQLAAVNEWTLDQLSAEDVVVREFYLAHNAIDRDRDVFDPALLADFAKTLPGKGFFIKHPNSFDGDSGPGEGLWFAAEVIETSHAEARRLLKSPDLKWVNQDTRASILVASLYLVKTAENEALLKKMAAGIARYVSVGFSAADRQPITDGENNVIASRLLPPGEAFEGSMVWLGAQPGAQAFKQAQIFTESEPDDEGTDMKTEEKLQQATTELENLQKQFKTTTGADTVKEAFAAVEKALEDAKAFKALRDALGDDASILDDAESLKAQLQVAARYKSELIDEIVQAERVKGLIEGDDEETIKDAKAGFAAMSIDKLKRYRENVTRGLDEQQLTGGDPNPDKSGKGGEGKEVETPDKRQGKGWGLPGILGGAG